MSTSEPNCECGDNGPCERHADTLVVRAGGVRSAEEQVLTEVGDLMDCGVKLTEGDLAEYKRLMEAMQYRLGIGYFPDDDEKSYSDFEATMDLQMRVESYSSDLWVIHDDGYVIVRPHSDCPLLEA